MGNDSTCAYVMRFFHPIYGYYISCSISYV